MTKQEQFKIITQQIRDIMRKTKDIDILEDLLKLQTAIAEAILESN